LNAFEATVDAFWAGKYSINFALVRFSRLQVGVRVRKIAEQN